MKLVGRVGAHRVRAKRGPMAGAGVPALRAERRQTGLGRALINGRIGSPLAGAQQTNCAQREFFGF